MMPRERILHPRIFEKLDERSEQGLVIEGTVTGLPLRCREHRAGLSKRNNDHLIH